MKLPLWLLKFRARRLYYSYHDWADQYSCGREVFEYINPDAKLKRLKLEGLVEEIKARPQG